MPRWFTPAYSKKTQASKLGDAQGIPFFIDKLSGLHERDIFDLFLPEFDKPWVIHIRETCCCSTNALGGPTRLPKLWRIIEEGYSPRDPKKLTRRDVVDDQLNATAINMIHMAVTPKDRAHIRSLKTAKEAWDKLDKLFLGNASIQSSRFDEVNNMADNFVMIEGETPEEMYRRLIALAVQMQDLGATFVDDHWIKRKFHYKKSCHGRRS
ncbi:hypothetical protein QYE76_044032 [Lolium multiflorum]|uniref:Uncharacterized protein n=1 Tax=Lolium multiflorum TaxID=4521 RepID=A0AAD8TI24_LOLMU|nr:hypothetical protein QYE76_044032 [Lolium multiflorum]